MNKGVIQWTGKNPEYKSHHTSPLLLQSLSTAAVLLLSSAQNSEHLRQRAKSSQHQPISRGPQGNCSGLRSAQTLYQYRCLSVPPLPYLRLSSHRHSSSLQAALHTAQVLCRQLLLELTPHMCKEQGQEPPSSRYSCLYKPEVRKQR